MEQKPHSSRMKTLIHIPSDAPSLSQWKKIGDCPHHGIALPLLALRNPKGSAIGEYLDLIPIIEWCKQVGFDVIQLLPLNDSGSDSSPYSALTAMGLHPIYLSLWALPYIHEFHDLELLLEPLRKCNSSQRVAYNQVRRNKEKVLKIYFERFFERISKTHEYQDFIIKNHWVTGYALFKAIKDSQDQKAWFHWDSALQNPDGKLISSLTHKFANEVNFYTLLQYLSFSQWAQVKKAAEDHGVFIKGDIPILINRDSADVWLERNNFNLDFAAGAPPDHYSDEGQYWGFPTYNWDYQATHHYDWWKRRLHVAQTLYHLFRIDHIVGFFRIWAIPEGKKAKEGFFLPADQAKWIPQGEKILHMMLHTSSMLPIGEDLGVVPDEVRACLAHLGICGTKVIRWERRWHEDRSYIPVTEYPPLSMTCVSTHDSTTLEQWWRNGGEEVTTYAASKGWTLTDTLDKDKQLEILNDSHRSASLFHINLLQEYLALFPELVWENPDDERINIPGIVLDENWTYRFRPTINEIVHHKGLKEIMQGLSHQA